MKVLAFAAAIALVSGAAQAGEMQDHQAKLVVKNENVYTQLCMAALESKYVMQEKARELGVNTSRLRQLTCNGMSPREFRATYGTEQIVTRATQRPNRDQ